MPDSAGQRLAQGKCLNGQDFVRSKRSSKRTQTPIWRLWGGPLGTPKYDQKLKKSTFSMCHQNTKMDPKKVKSELEMTFFVPRVAAMRCQTAPASAWPKANA